MFSVIFLSIAGLVCAISCPASNNTQYRAGISTYNIHCGVDYYGGDLFYVGRISSFEQCLTLCAANPLCKDVAFIPTLRRCYLKSTLTPARQNPAIWSAVLAEVESELSCTYYKSNGTIYTASPGRQYQVLCGVDSRYYDIAQSVSLNLEDCIGFCDRTTGCVTVAMKSNICYAKNRLNTLTANRQVAVARLLGPSSTVTTTTATTISSTVSSTLSAATTTTTTIQTTTTTTTTTTEPTTTTTESTTTSSTMLPTIPSPTAGPTTCEPQTIVPSINLPSPTLILRAPANSNDGDDNSAWVSLPQGVFITLYGTSFDFMKVSTNGVISLSQSVYNYPLQGGFANLPNSGLPNYVISPFWFDLYVNSQGGIWYSIVDNVIYIEWRTTLYSEKDKQFPAYSVFQVQQNILVPNVVTYNYFTICAVPFPNIGVQKSSNIGYGYSHPQNTPENGWQIICDTNVEPGTCIRTQ